jgi:hypothetical protein
VFRARPIREAASGDFAADVNHGTMSAAMHKKPCSAPFSTDLSRRDLAVVPVAITGFIIFWVNRQITSLSTFIFGERKIPFVAILSCSWRWRRSISPGWSQPPCSAIFPAIVDKLLVSVPGLRQFYTAWKQIASPPAARKASSPKVVVIPDETGATYLLGFSNGRPIEGDADTFCVFVPAAPNPINGRCISCIETNASSSR